MEPISSGIQCELAVSISAQSDMIEFVRSDKSFLPKKDNGRRLNFSASALRLTPLSTYVEKNVALYCKYVVNAISKSATIIPAIKNPSLSFGAEPSRRYDDNRYKSPTGSINTRFASVTATNAHTILWAPLSDNAYLCFNFSIIT